MMNLVLTPRMIGEQLSGNVVADVPGADPSAGIILIGGHLDSWDLGTGAIDDAAGVAITAAAAKRIMDAPGRPRRTIRVVWWGSEETGGYGSDSYFEKHNGEKVVAAAESDFGADRVWRMQTSIGNEAVRNRLAAALAPLGVVASDGKPEGGADVEKWGEAGVALVDLDQDGTRYFDLHHTADDTLDKIDPKQLNQNVAAWTAMLSVLADAPEEISRSAVK
jgi:Zn-dependent M28 family amino/carboxypeptidase